MSTILRNTGPRVLTLLVGLLLLVSYFLEVPSPIVDFADLIPRWCIVIVALAVGVGAITLCRNHLSDIAKRKPGQWGYSIVMLVTMLLFVVVGLGMGVNHPWFDWIFGNILAPCSTTTYAMWCFFISSACFRVIRVKNKESATLLISAVLVMLSNAALGELIWGNFPLIGSWIRTVPMMAVFRSLNIGVGLGLILLGIRVLLGHEKGYAGGS